MGESTFHQFYSWLPLSFSSITSHLLYKQTLKEKEQKVIKGTISKQ